jgi:hypothetical protein
MLTKTVKRRNSILVIVAAVVIVGLGILGSQRFGNSGSHLPPTTFAQIFGSSYHSENVSISQFSVGANVSFDGVSFTRLAFTPTSLDPTGFNLTWTFTATSTGGSGYVPSQDGSWAYSTGSSGQTAGFIVYPNEGVIELAVKS